MILIAFLSIWGASRGRGPFLESEPLNNVLSLQLFLLFAAAPFMVFAALAEERKQGEEELREGEERLRLAVQAGMMYAFEWDMASDGIVRTGQYRDILNWMDDPIRDTGRQFSARVHPDDRKAYAATETGLTAENPTYHTIYRLLRPDGSVIWLDESGRGFFDGKGRMLRTIGMVADVTEHKLAEQTVSSVSRRLIEAQEQERARIARELHDDLSQRMAILSVSLEQFDQGIPDISSNARQQMRKIKEIVREVASDIHDLSHRLHPSKLDILGLVASLGGLCREFSEQHNLQVEFVSSNIRGRIPKDVTLCLFRIVQEALRNVVKHSGTTEAKVELSSHGDGIDLCISDSGAGFSPESAKEHAGLGLVSMRERLRLVGGRLSIESDLSHGTRIRAHVPLSTTNPDVTNQGKARAAEA
jgi:signal transduction histidine kinase